MTDSTKAPPVYVVLPDNPLVIRDARERRNFHMGSQIEARELAELLNEYETEIARLKNSNSEREGIDMGAARIFIEYTDGSGDHRDVDSREEAEQIVKSILASDVYEERTRLETLCICRQAIKKIIIRRISYSDDMGEEG